MAGKGAGGVSDFVHNRDADSQGTRPSNALQTKGSNDDLKIKPARTSAANTHQTRTAVLPQSKQRRPQAEPRKARRESDGDRLFYDTEGSIDDSSVTSSARHTRADMAGATHNGRPNGHSHGADAAGSGGGSDHGFVGEEFGEQSSNFGDGHQHRGFGNALPSSARRLMETHEKPTQEVLLQRGAGLPHLKGIDSYPDTTSGTPSVDELNESKHIKKKSQAQGQDQSRTRQAQTVSAQPTAPTAQDQRPPHQMKAGVDQSRGNVQGNFLVDPRKGDRSVEQQLVETFSFGKANKQTVPIFAQQKARVQPSPGVTESRQQVSNNTVDRGTFPSTHDNANAAPRQVHAPNALTDVHEPPSRHHHGASRSQKQQQAFSQVEQRPIDQEQISDHSSESDEDVQGEVPNGALSQHVTGVQDQPDKMHLDYDPDELFNMDYHTVKAQSFDIDPNAEDLTFPDAESTADLSSKMHAAAGFPPQDRGAFLASLSIDEWEQAGDWFITRFSEVLNKLKTNRKETREAAKAFENDIEKRHGAVSKKRKQIDDELTEMRESGGKVLQGTPKKAKMK